MKQFPVVVLLLTTAITLNSCKKDIHQPQNGTSAPETLFGNITPDPARVAKQHVINGVEIYYYETDGKKIMDGDIELTDEFLNGAHEKGTGRTLSAVKWPNAIVYYTVDPAFTNPARVDDAIAQWTQNTNIKFGRRTTQSNYVTFRNGGLNSSPVGMNSGQNFIDIASYATTGDVIHEIGHTVGLWHEIARTDRNSHVTIHTQNITPGYEYNFQRYVDAGVDGFDTPNFDYGSIMMLSPYAFSKNASTTITRPDGLLYNYQNTALSDGDMLTVNQMYPQPTEELYIMENDRLYAVDNVTGNYENIGSTFWSGAATLASLNGYLYSVQGTKIHRINKNTGARTTIGSGNWSGTEAMTSYDGALYLVQNSRIYRVDGTTGTYMQIGNAVWGGTEAICGTGNRLYLVQNGHLYEVDPSTGTYSQVGTGTWSGTEGIANVTSGFLHLVNNSRIYKVDLATGIHIQIGNAVWGGTEGMAAYGSSLYVVQNSRLYQVDPNSGGYIQLGGIAWPGTQGITGM